MSKLVMFALALTVAVICVAGAVPARAATFDLSLNITNLTSYALGASKGTYHGTLTTASYDSTPSGRFTITGMSISLPNSFYGMIEIPGPSGDFYNFSGSTTTAMVANDKSGTAAQIVPIVDDSSLFAANPLSVKSSIPTTTPNSGVSWTLLFNSTPSNATDPSFALSRAAWSGGSPQPELYAYGTYSLSEAAAPAPGGAAILGTLAVVGFMVGFRRRKALRA